MKTQFNCPHCKKPLEADETIIGKKAKCPACGKELTVPSDKRKVASEAR
jgi:transcription initiation factor IIE alpha subunit